MIHYYSSQQAILAQRPDQQNQDLQRLPLSNTYVDCRSADLIRCQIRVQRNTAD